MEVYDLPVKFTEEEREYYAAWGIRGAQIFNLCLVFFIFMLIWGLVATIIRLLGLFNEDYWLYKTIVWSSDIWVSLINVAGMFLVILVNFVLNLLFNRRKPNFIKIVKITIEESSLTVELWKKKRKLGWQKLALGDVSECLDVDGNAVILMGKAYEIGLNTTKNIYESHNVEKYPVLDHPIYKARAIGDVAQMKDIIDDYMAALEVKKKEQTWLQEHGLKEE